MPQGPPNPGFMQEKVQKGDFLKKPSRELNFFCCFRFLWISRRPGTLNWKRLVFLLSKILYKKCDVDKLFVFNTLLTIPSNVLPVHLKQTFPPISWTFTEGEGDGIESRLPLKIFSTIKYLYTCNKNFNILSFYSMQVYLILPALWQKPLRVHWHGPVVDLGLCQIESVVQYHSKMDTWPT